MGDKDKGLLDRLKTADGNSQQTGNNTNNVSRETIAPDNQDNALLGRLKQNDQDATSTNSPDAQAPVSPDAPAPAAPALPQSMGAVNTGGNPDAAHDDLKFATDVMANMIGADDAQALKDHVVTVGGKTQAGNYAEDSYKATGEFKRKSIGSGAGDMSPIVNGQKIQTAPTTANVEAARSTIKGEVQASSDFVGGFIQSNKDDLAKYPALSGNYTAQNKDFDVISDATIKSITSPTGDKTSLASFSNISLSLLEQRQKSELSDLDNQYPLVRIGGNIESSSYGQMRRQDEGGYNAAKQIIDKKFNDQKTQLVGAITNLAQLKAANDFISKKGPNTAITDKDYLQIGLDVAEGMGAPGIDKTKNYASTGRLSDAEKVYYERIGGDALRYKTMQAAGEGQDAIAQELHNSNGNYQRKIIDANPGFRKQQVINAISDQIYKDTKGASNPDVTPEIISDVAQKLNIDPKDVQDIAPADIKREPNTIQSWLSGLNEATGKTYEFGMRHVVAPVFNHLGGAALTGNDITDEQLDKAYPTGWWDNSGLGGTILTGGPKPGASSLFGQAQKVNTDMSLPYYLDNIANPDAEKFQPHLAQFIHSSANMLGNLTGFIKGSGAIAEGVSGLNLVNDAATAEKYGTAAMMVLQNHDDNMKMARQDIPGDNPDDLGKQLTMGLLYTGLDIASVEMFSPLDIKNKIFGGDNTFGNEMLGILKKEGPEGLRYNNTGGKLLAKAIKESGADWAKMTGGMTLAQAGKTIVDYALAPDKFKNEDPGSEIAQTAISNGILNLIPSVAAGVGSAKREGAIKEMLPYEVGSNPRTYLDGIDKMLKLGKIDQATADEKTNTVNTLANIVNSAPSHSLESGKPLSETQRSAYVSSLFNEEIATTQKAKTKDKVQQQQLEGYIKREQEKRGEIMKALDNSEILAPIVSTGLNSNQYETPNPGALQESGDKTKTEAQDEGQSKVLSNPGTPAESSVAPGNAAPVPDIPVAERTITVGEMLDQPVTLDGRKATLYQDGQTVVAKFTDTPGDRVEEKEVGNIDQIKDHSIKDYGMEQESSVVKVNDKGNIEIRGEEYHNLHTDPLAAINYNDHGERVSVTLDKPIRGKSGEVEGYEKRTLRGDVAEDAAYQIQLAEINKRNETGALEQFINTDREARAEIKSARAENELERAPAEPGPTTGPRPVDDAGPRPSANSEEGKPVAKVPRRKIERNPVDQPPLFHSVDPAFDFEPEPVHNQEEAAPAAQDTQEKTVPETKTENPTETNVKPEVNAAPANNSPSETEIQKKKAETFFNAPRTDAENVETAKVGDNIKEKFNNAEKIVGNHTSRVLDDGTKLPGHYVLIDATGVTPSNDPASMRTSEGFPTLEDGRNPNDRDYTQPSNEANVRKRAGDYDGRAVEKVPTVDKNGVVIDGNDRTMSGQLAAQSGKDGKYYTTLKEKARDFGFTPEQVIDMKARNKNPRVIFVPDAILPYTTQTFAKFNPKTVGKVKTGIEEAIQFGRTAPQKLIDALGRLMDGYDKVSNFFADKSAVKSAVDLLEAHGMINSDNKNAYYSPEQRTFTHEGKDLLQNIMLGKTFDEESLRLLQNHNDIREKMIFAMNNIMAIEAKGPEYSLKQHISEALHLWDKVENYRENVANLPASEEGRETAYEQYMAQQSLFEDPVSPESKIIWADMNNRKKSSLRELTKSYLHAANEHGNGADMFGNLPPKREELLEQYFINKEHEKQLLIAARAATGSGTERPAAGEGEQAEQTGDETPQSTSEANATERSQPGQASEPVKPTDALFEPDNNVVSEPIAEVTKIKPPAGTSSAPPHISELLKKKPKELTPEERHQIYQYDKSQLERYDELVKTKQLRVDDLRDQAAEMEQLNKQDTPEYKELKRKIAGNEYTLDDAKRQRSLAADGIAKYEGKRAGDVLREWANTNLKDDLVYSSPFGFVPKTIKALVDLVAKGLDAGWNLRHAIRRAIADHKAADPEFARKMAEAADNENITANWLHSKTVEKLNDHTQTAPALDSVKNKQLADAIISKIKNNEISLTDATDKIYDHPAIPDETKLKIIQYIEHNTINEESNIRDRNNKNFLDDYKMQATDELKNFASGKTIEDVFGEAPIGEQAYMTDKLGLMLNDADKMIGLAQYHWGSKITDYGPKLLDAINKMSRDEGPKKGSLLATYLGKLHEAQINGAGDQGTIKNLLDSAEQSWQKYINQVGKELNTGRLLRLYRDHNLSEFYADKILSEKEQKAKQKIQDALTNEKISDEVAQQGVLRDQAEVIAEEKAKSAERAKESEAPDKKTAKKESGDKVKEGKEKKQGKADDLFAEKAAAKLKEIKSPDDLLNKIKEQIKKTKC